MVSIYKDVTMEGSESHSITNTPIDMPTSIDVRAARPGRLTTIRGQFLVPIMPAGPYTSFQDVDPTPSQNDNIVGQIAMLNDTIINLT